MWIQSPMWDTQLAGEGDAHTPHGELSVHIWRAPKTGATFVNDQPPTCHSRGQRREGRREREREGGRERGREGGIERDSESRRISADFIRKHAP
jgi:hypothetical protein